MKNAGGFTSVCLRKDSKIPIYKQLGDALLTLIEDGVLETDSKLPPIRKMADSLKINSSTVVNAYKYLETKNAVYSFSGSGTYVAPVSVKTARADIPLNEPVSEAFAAKSAASGCIDFTSVNVPESLFPKTEIKSAFSTVTDEFGAGFFKELHGNRYEPLIEILTRRLQKDGIPAKSNSVFVTNKALELAASAVVKKGDTVIVEKPVAYSKIGVFAERGANVVQAELCRDGVALDGFEALLKTYRPKAVHLSTYFQTPSNVCYSLQNKRATLELCYKYGAYIIEEDAFSDLLIREKKVFMKSLDYREHVIYVKNITKICMPWLSASACVFPQKLVENAEKSQFSLNMSVGGVQMRVLTELMKNGFFDEHMKNIVKIDEVLWSKTAEIINERLCDFVEYDENKIGAFFWLKLKYGGALEFVRKCAEKGVLLSPEELFCSNANVHVRLCPRSASVENGMEKIAQGIELMKAAFEGL